MHFSVIDWVLLAIYFIFLLVIAFLLSRRRKTDEESYLLDGRRLTLPSFVATTVSTWYGGILGVGEYTYNHGISNWLVFGVPYYIAALIFALFLAERVRRSRLLSIPDQLDKVYGGKVAVTGALYVFVMTVPAAYILMLGVLLKLIFGWQLAVGVVIAAIVSSGYVLIGGFRSVIKTDWLQFSLMYAAFLLIVIKVVPTFGGLDFLRANVPDTHFDWRGGATAGYVISWYFIALAALVEPAFYQRCYAAKSPQVARRGLLISILFWMFFDFLTTTTGMYARAVLGDGVNGLEAFPMLADRVLPAGIKGLFFIGLITTIQSTIDSYSFLAASTLGRDVLWRIRALKSRIGQVGLTRWGLLFSGLIAIGIALMSKSVIDIWHRLGSIGTPGLLLPLALSYSERWRFRRGWALTNLIIAPALVGIWFIIRSVSYNGDIPFPFSIQPIFIGISASSLLLIFDHLTRRK